MLPQWHHSSSMTLHFNESTISVIPYYFIESANSVTPRINSSLIKASPILKGLRLFNILITLGSFPIGFKGGSEWDVQNVAMHSEVIAQNESSLQLFILRRGPWTDCIIPSLWHKRKEMGVLKAVCYSCVIVMRSRNSKISFHFSLAPWYMCLLL